MLQVALEDVCVCFCVCECVCVLEAASFIGLGGMESLGDYITHGESGNMCVRMAERGGGW